MPRHARAVLVVPAGEHEGGGVREEGEGGVVVAVFVVVVVYQR